MRYTIAPLFFLFLLLFSSCGEQRVDGRKAWFSENGRIKVLATTAMIADLVQEIGGDRIDVLTLIQGDLDPHSYQLVKGDDEKLAFADLIFFNGLGLEHGASTLRFLQSSPHAYSLGSHLLHEEPKAIIFVDQAPDPHIWMDMSLWAKTIPYIVATLSEYDLEGAPTFSKRGNALQSLLMEKHQAIRDLFLSLPPEKRYLVTSHDAFHYFARAYLADEGETAMEQWNPRVAAPEGLSPDSQLSVQDIQEIVAHLHRYNIHVLFPETNVSRDAIYKIVSSSQEMGFDVTIAEDPLYADAMGSPGTSGDTYVKMLEHNAHTIHKYLQK